MSRENSQIIASASGVYVRANVTKMGHDSEHPYCSRSISGVMWSIVRNWNGTMILCKSQFHTAGHASQRDHAQMHSGPRRTLNGSRHSRSKLAAACLDDDGDIAFEDSKPANGGWTEIACETAGGTFRIGLQRSEIGCT